MAWIAVTADNVATRLTDAELTTYTSVSLADGDPLPGIITQSVDEARGYVGASGKYALGDGQTIPQKLLGAVLALVRYRLIKRLPIPVDAERTREYDDALKLLARVADGKFDIEEPETPDSETSQSASSPRVTAPERKFTEDTQDGI